MTDLSGIGAIIAAAEGNLQPLADRVRFGLQLNHDERELAASIIEGTWRKPNHRPAKVDTERRKLACARYVAYLEVIEGWKTEAAVTYAMENMSLSRTYVFQARRKYGPAAERIVRRIYEVLQP